MTKWYFEVSATGTSNFETDQSAGVFEGGATLTSIFNNWPSNNTPLHGIGLHFGNGLSSENGNPIVLNGTRLAKTGDVFGNMTAFAVIYDQIADTVYFKGIAGSSVDITQWNYSALANPTTGVGGFDVSGLTKPLFPGLIAANNTGIVATFNFGATAFLQGPPSGCTAGWLTNGINTTLNPADFQSGTLSGGNLVFTATVSGVPSGVRASGPALGGATQPIISTNT